MDTPSNAVLAAKIDALKEIVEKNQERSHEAHVAIITQTTKTNGRVTALEKTKNIMLGGLIFLNLVIVPVFVALAVNYLKTK